MAEPEDTMRQMAQLSKILGGLPGVDGERIDRESAEKMRKTVAEGLSSVMDDYHEVDIHESIREHEDRMLSSDEVDTSDMTEGEARMLCQIAVVKGMMEEE